MEAYTTDKIDELAGVLVSKLANKDVTIKSLQSLEKKINDVYLYLAKDNITE